MGIEALPFKRVSDCDRENMPNWTDFDESESLRMFTKAFKSDATPTAEQKREVMRMCRSVVLTAKLAKVGPYQEQVRTN